MPESPYEQQVWNDRDSNTPLRADRMNHMEDGIKNALTPQNGSEVLFQVSPGVYEPRNPDARHAIFVGPTLPASGMLPGDEYIPRST